MDLHPVAGTQGLGSRKSLACIAMAAVGIGLIAWDFQSPAAWSVNLGQPTVDAQLTLSVANVLGMVMIASALATLIPLRFLSDLRRPTKAGWRPILVFCGLLLAQTLGVWLVGHLWPQSAQPIPGHEIHAHARNTWFFGRDAQFSDLIEPTGWFQGNVGLENSFYPPFGLLIAKLLSGLPLQVALLLLIIALMTSIAVGVRAARGRRPWQAFVLAVACMASYPIQMTVERGNIEAFALPLFTLTWLLIDAPRARMIASSLAVAIKYFSWPVGWHALRGRVIRNGVVQTVLILGVSVGSCVALGLPLSQLLAPLRALAVTDKGMYTLDLYDPNSAVQFASSLDAGIVTFVHLVAAPLEPTALAFLQSSIWLVVKVAAIVLGVVAVTLGKKPLWARATIAVTLFILLPVFSPDYKLIVLLPVLFLLLRSWRGLKREWLCLVLFGLLLAPQSWRYFETTGTSTSVPLKSLELLVLLIAAATAPAKEATQTLKESSQERNGVSQSAEPLAG